MGVVEAVESAEVEARRLHDAGRCGESQWSCTHCEDEEGSKVMTHRTLAQCYDADLARRDPVVARLRTSLEIPHPLYEVRYADGVLRDTTAGRVRSHGRVVA